jgi:hypothetical protein
MFAESIVGDVGSKRSSRRNRTERNARAKKNGSNRKNGLIDFPRYATLAFDHLPVRAFSNGSLGPLSSIRLLGPNSFLLQFDCLPS